MFAKKWQYFFSIWVFITNSTHVYLHPPRHTHTQAHTNSHTPNPCDNGATFSCVFNATFLHSICQENFTVEQYILLCEMQQKQFEKCYMQQEKKLLH